MPKHESEHLKHGDIDDFVTLSRKLKEKMSNENKEAKDWLDKILAFFNRMMTGKD